MTIEDCPLGGGGSADEFAEFEELPPLLLATFQPFTTDQGNQGEEDDGEAVMAGGGGSGGSGGGGGGGGSGGGEGRTVVVYVHAQSLLLSALRDPVHARLYR